jgi:hypothetical protein
MTKRSRILRSRRKGVGNEEGEGRREEENLEDLEGEEDARIGMMRRKRGDH